MSEDYSYKVGYGRPPLDSRFQKGRSGNPKGRPKGVRNLKTDLERELNETLRIREGDREYRTSKQAAMVKSLIARAIKGDTRATAAVFNLCLRLLDVTGASAAPEEISSKDQLLLENLIKRRLSKNGETEAMPSDEADDEEVSS